MIRLILILIFLFIGCAKTPGEPSDGNEIEEEEFNNSLDIMTWNLQNFPKDPITVEYVINLIISSNLDIIALQEIESSTDFIDLVNSLPGWNGFRANSAYMDLNLAYLYNDNVQIINIYEIYPNFNPLPRPPLIMEITFSNKQFSIINNHYKCCGNGIIQIDTWDEEYRRQQASIYLKNYIDSYLSDENVIVLGDFNDELTDPEEDNVFWNFISDPDEYLFVDMGIANGSPEYFSYPTYGTSGSHIDHILITNELFNYVNAIQTVLYDLDNDGDSDADDWWIYERYITDHRPVRISITTCMNEDDACSK